MSRFKSRNDIPTYRRHKASGRAVVTLEGRDFYLGEFNTPESRAEYDRIINEWLARGRRIAETGTGTDGMLVKELILGYHGHLVATMPDEVSRAKLALKPVRDMYGNTPADKFGPVAFQAVRQKMIEDGLCASTIRMRLGVIKRMVGWGVANEMLRGDALYRLQAVAPLRDNQPGVKPPKRVLPVADSDIQAVLPHVTPTTRAMIELQALTGMRPGEVCRITTGQIDRTVDPWIYRPTQHKSKNRGKDRVVPLGPRAQELLTPWLRADPDAPLFSPKETSDRSDEARRRPTRTPEQRARRRKGGTRRHFQATYNKTSYASAIERGCIRAGISVFRPNRIRHTYATHVRHEYGLEAAQVLLGHSKADVTQIYAERDWAKAVEVAKKIG
jgi:integrase